MDPIVAKNSKIINLNAEILDKCFCFRFRRKQIDIFRA